MSKQVSRRDFLKYSGALAGASAIGSSFPWLVEAKDSKGNGKHNQIFVPNMGDTNYWEMLMFSCLQGFANREYARVFCYYPTKSKESWYDRHPVPEKRYFYEWYKQYNHLNFAELVSPYLLFDQLADSKSNKKGEVTHPFKGYVLVDTEAPITANIAANYASIEDLLPVTEEILKDHKGEMPDLDVIRDLRGKFRQMSKLEVYEWAFENQWPKANHARVANLGTPEPAPADKIPTNSFYTSNRSRDFTIADRGFFFELASNGEDYALKDRIYSAMDHRGYVFGWHQGAGETAHISQVSKHGLLALGASTYAANFSFHNRVKVPGAVQRFKRKASRPKVAGPLEDKIYLTFVLSDGDSLNFLARRGQGGQWQLPERGKIPFGWEIQPLLADIAPGLLDYFQATATENDFFVDGVSGIGYFYPEEMPKDVLRSILEDTKPYLKKTGERMLSLMSPTGPVTDETAQIYADVLGDHLTGVMEGYVRRGATKVRIYGGKQKNGNGRIPIRPSDATVWLPTSNPEGDESVENWVQDLRKLAERRPERPIFVPLHIPAHRLTIADMVEVVEKIGPDFKVVAPDEFYALYAQARPGTIVVESPESFTPRESNLVIGRENVVTTTLQSFHDQSVSVDLQMKITSNKLESDLIINKEVTLPVQDIAQVSFTVDIPESVGKGNGTLEYSINGESPVVSKPITFDTIAVDDQVYEAEDLKHRQGKRINDPDALNGFAWQAIEGQHNGDVSSNHVIWGPTKDQDKNGNYVARFRMKVDDNTKDLRVARIDAVSNIPGNAPVGPSRDIKATDFAKSGEYEYFDVPFSLPIIDSPIPPAQMQYRVAYEGNATLTIDRIEVSMV